MPWRETAAELERARAEEPETFPAPAGRLFGIFTPPDPAAARAAQCVVLFTRPRSHRNRMWVEAARRLAAHGFGAFRFDYHGTGDSEGESGFLDPNRPYRDDATAVLRLLRERHGYERFLLAGSCFDARTALSSFVDHGAAVDGLVFFSAPVMELDTLVKVHADRKDWRHLWRAPGNPEDRRALALHGHGAGACRRQRLQGRGAQRHAARRHVRGALRSPGPVRREGAVRVRRRRRGVRFVPGRAQDRVRAALTGGARALRDRGVARRRARVPQRAAPAPRARASARVARTPAFTAVRGARGRLARNERSAPLTAEAAAPWISRSRRNSRSSPRRCARSRARR